MATSIVRSNFFASTIRRVSSNHAERFCFDASCSGLGQHVGGVCRARVCLSRGRADEAHRLKPDAFLRFLETSNEFSFLFVDDGSSDRTSHILADLAQRGRGRVQVLTLPRNVGKAAAVQQGVLASMARSPEFVGYWDADLSTPLDALPEFVEVLRTRPEVEVVTGARVKLLGREIRRSALRHYVGRVFATAASLTLGIPVYDTQCGAKLFRAGDSLRRAFTAPFESDWVFDVELFARYVDIHGQASAGRVIYELPLKRWIDVPGTKLKVRHGLKAFWDLAAISYKRARSR